jgi:hypothetical protein
VGPVGARSRPLRVVIGTLLGVAVYAVLYGASRADGGDTDPRQAVITHARAVDLLEKRLDLAKGEQFYLVVDPSDRSLQLMLQGAVLRDYPILGLEVGTPRIAFRERRVSHGWAGRLWDGGELVPARDRERLEMQPPDSTETDSTATPPLPPTPEEAYPVPHRYLVRYEGGLSLEVRPEALDSSVTTWKRVATAARVWMRDLPAALRRQPEDTVRLRLVLRPEDAESLYRALPPDTRLLVLPAL